MSSAVPIKNSDDTSEDIVTMLNRLKEALNEEPHYQSGSSKSSTISSSARKVNQYEPHRRDSSQKPTIRGVSGGNKSAQNNGRQQDITSQLEASIKEALDLSKPISSSSKITPISSNSRYRYVEEVPYVGKTPEQIRAISDEISRNLQAQFAREDAEIAKKQSKAGINQQKSSSLIERFRAYNKRRDAEVRAEVEEYEQSEREADAAAKAKREQKKQAKAAAKQTKAEKKTIKGAAKQSKATRYTEPKKRNMLIRMIHRRKYKNGDYEDIENDLLDGYYTRNDVKVSQHATKRKDKKLYKKVQTYEDARDDKTAGKVYSALVAGLAGVMLLATIKAGTVVHDTFTEIKNDYYASTTEESLDYEDMDHDTQIYYASKTQDFIESVQENDGYVFDYLSDEELVEGYAKILRVEKKKTSEAIFKVAFKDIATNGDMTLLDEFVEDALGTEAYNALTNEQKRDYRQLAYELLPTALPKFFGEDADCIAYIRNPIVVDELEARDSAQEKGYKITLWTNDNLNRADTIKNLGSLLHVVHEMDDYDYSALNLTDGGEVVLTEMLKYAIGEEEYEKLDKKAQRDYEQVAYEWLNKAKTYIMDPITREQQLSEEQIVSSDTTETYSATYTDGNITIYGSTASTDSTSTHSQEDEDYTI